MKLLAQPISKALQPAYRVQNVERGKLERFKTELARLLEHLGHSAQESEEHLKNIVSDFLKAAFYREEHFVNTKDRQDLVIHNGRTAKESVGVIIETKKPGNKSEMISPDKPNAKALHELLRYYLNERSRADNKEIRHLVVTDIHAWYIFDAADFERHIYANTKLLKQYTDWQEGRLGAGNTDWFYKEIAAPFFEKELPELHCCTFDLRDYVTAATNNDPNDDELLLDLYKILSPQHLLKKPFANDSNALNKQFYDELLYILGLEEVKEGGKKIIDRASKRRSEGSLLENTLSELEVSGVWRDATGLDQFGDTPEYQRFSIALELCITWLNRILFLKLLEGQLLRWRAGSDRLLAVERVKDYDELNELFFHVLAVPEGERRESVQQKFNSVPYLNSSLFEQTELERRTLRVSSLTDRLTMPVLPNSVLRQNPDAPREMPTLAYLFAFLDAYDFSSDAKARIQAENRAVINASVLGLIFEKINGYRDGSFFTPGFITMYMCRETLRRAVLQKFNERYGWDCANVETDLHNELIRQKTPLKAAHELINSLRICDPAVGSGHFLVSALNELIAIKSELGILCDSNSKLLNINAVVGNDELILTDSSNDQPIEYQPGNMASQRIQEALFHEKQTLIENCLFGVDINPKSVMICRLRLWVELLKHAYFTAESKYQRLETLPNIDINIKSGNSLVSRFALDEDLSDVFRKQRFSHADYLLAVQSYKNVRSKDGKEELRAFIQKIKDEFRQTVFNRNPFAKTLSQKRGQLVLLDNNLDLFGEAKKDADTVKKEKVKLHTEVADLERQLEEYKSGPLYRNSFEWRFEFPEVLDEKGDYLGFDVVLGNPPYIRIQELQQSASQQVEWFNQNFYTAGKGNYDIYVLFIERGLNILCPKGRLSYILPHKFFNANYGQKTRAYLSEKKCVEQIIHFGAEQVFEEASIYTAILLLENSIRENFRFSLCNDLISFQNEPRQLPFANILTSSLTDAEWNLSLDDSTEMFSRWNEFPTLADVTERIFQGLKTSADKIYILEKLGEGPTHYEVFSEQTGKNYSLEKVLLKPLIKGGDSRRYVLTKPNRLILFPYKEGKLMSKDEIIALAPMAWQYLLENQEYLENRENGKMKTAKWYGYVYPKALEVISKPKIFTPDIAPSPRFSFDDVGEYHFTGGTAGGYGVLPKSTVSFYFLLGLLNSQFSAWFIARTSTQMRGGWYSFESRFIAKMPIPDLSEKEQQPIIALVTRILAAKQTDPKSDTTALESEVDALVYGLYGLTEEEIAIVEGT